MAARIALLGDRDLGYVTHRELEARRLAGIEDATHAEVAPGEAPFTGFHWCGYGVAEPFVARLEAAGVVVSARAPDAGVEGIELPDHPFFVATLFQPQVGALAGRPPHPLIRAFVESARAVVRG